MKARLGPNSLERPEERENLSSVVIYDDFGAPILIVQRLATGLILSYKATDPKFEQVMESLGIGLNKAIRYSKVTSNGSRKAEAPQD